MQLLKFMESVDLVVKSETERAKLLCFYHYKENSEATFTMTNISAWLEECNFCKPNASRLKEHLIKGKGKSFVVSKTVKGSIEFVPAVLQADRAGPFSAGDNGNGFPAVTPQGE